MKEVTIMVSLSARTPAPAGVASDVGAIDPPIALVEVTVPADELRNLTLANVGLFSTKYLTPTMLVLRESLMKHEGARPGG